MSTYNPAAGSQTFKITVIGGPAAGKTTLIKRLQFGQYVAGIRTTLGIEFAQKACRVDGRNVTCRLFDLSGQDSTMNASRTYYQGAVGTFVVVDGSNPASLDMGLKWKADLDLKTADSRFARMQHTSAGHPFSNGLDSAAAAAAAHASATGGSGRSGNNAGSGSGNSSSSNSKDAAAAGAVTNRRLPCIMLINKCDLGVSVGKTKEQLEAMCQRHGICAVMETSAVTGENVNEALENLVRLMTKAVEEAAADASAADNGPQGIVLGRNLKQNNNSGSACDNC